jgi:hypothetical protein
MWDLEFLVDDMVGWLNKSTVFETSKVGILSSPRLLGLIQPFVEDDIMEQFYRKIYAISLAYTRPHTPDRHHLATPELLQIGSFAGHKFLRNLDKLLKPQHSRACSLDQLRALFLLIFGAVLATGYTSPQPSGNTEQELAQFKDTQDFLRQILAKGTENVNHARPRHASNIHRYGDDCGSAEYVLQYGEDSGLFYHIQTAKEGSQALSKVSYRQVSVLPTFFSVRNSFTNCWKCYTCMTAPKFGRCIECNDFGIVRMLIPVDAEASSSSTLGGALTSWKHLLI